MLTNQSFTGQFMYQRTFGTLTIEKRDAYALMKDLDYEGVYTYSRTHTCTMTSGDYYVVSNSAVTDLAGF